MRRKILSCFFILLFAAGLAGCASAAGTRGKEATVDLQRLALVKIHSAQDDALLAAIEDVETLSRFAMAMEQSTGGNEMDGADYTKRQEALKQRLKSDTALYRFAAYKASAALVHDGEPEEIFFITIYRGTKVIMIEASQESVKSFSVPSESLRFYGEISEKDKDFLLGLAEGR